MSRAVTVPTWQDFRAELLKQDEPEAKEIALAIELFTHGSLNTFAKQTNVDTNNRLMKTIGEKNFLALNITVFIRFAKHSIICNYKYCGSKNERYIFN